MKNKRLSVVLVVLLLAGGFIGSALLRGRAVDRRLREKGVKTTAVIVNTYTKETTTMIRHRRHTSRTPYMEYEFTVGDSLFHEKTIRPSGCGPISRGDRIEIVYAADDPTINRPLRNENGCLRKIKPKRRKAAGFGKGQNAAQRTSAPTND